MAFLTKSNLRVATFKYAPLLLGLRVPGFIRIHFRYVKSSPFTWFVLFIAPYVIGVMSLSLISTELLNIQPSSLQLFFITLFFIALAFFFAERNRTFRKIYVIAIPTMVITNGLFRLFFETGISFGNLIAFGIVTILPAWLLGRHALGKGYRLLSNGADNDYRPGRDLYMEGQYDAAFEYLERSAKRGHMKALYLFGDAHEHGKGLERDLIKAARFYEKSGGKGYAKANLAFETLFSSFGNETRSAYETEVADVTKNVLL